MPSGIYVRKRSRFLCLLEQIRNCDPNSCLVWPSAGENQYGRIWHRGKLEYPHRLAFNEFYPDKFNPGLDVLHRCDNPPCFNPYHLFQGTDADNQRDSIQKGRVDRECEKNPNTRLSLDQVHAIQTGCISAKAAALQFRISLAHAYNIKAGKRWKAATRRNKK